MPIYMDRHDLDAVTARDVAEAHREDLKIQDQYRCRAITYWFDEQRRTAFCLIEAPDEDCVRRMHNDAHGLVPHRIIEVEANVVDAFLGRIEDPKSDFFLDGTNQPIINEPAFRIIMYICLNDLLLLKSVFGKNAAFKIINPARDTIQKSIIHHNGREVIKDSRRLVISFTSASNALTCAFDIKDELKKASGFGPEIARKINISISAGTPVTEQNGLFSETVQLAEWLCEIANRQHVVISSEANEVYKNEIFDETPMHSSVQVLSADDEWFIRSLAPLTDTILDDPNFDVGLFSNKVGLSRSQLYRKLTAITGMSPNEFIKEIRLKRALRLIEKKKGNIAQIAFGAGFNSPSYFSKCFQNRFGILPSEIDLGNI
jgi:AraC-like DNA-binding protein